MSYKGLYRGCPFLCMIIKTRSLNHLPSSETAWRSAAPPNTCFQLCFTGVKAREVTPGVGTLRKTCIIRFDLKSWELATMAGDLYKSNVLFMTHLGSVVSFIFSKKKNRETQHLCLIYSLADSLWWCGYNKCKKCNACHVETYWIVQPGFLPNFFG